MKQANSDRHIILGADDLLPLMVWVLVRGKVVDAEIEAEYMWGLLHNSLLNGEGGYYLTTLSSAVQALKNFKSSQNTVSTSNVSNIRCMVHTCITNRLFSAKRISFLSK